MSDGSAIEWCDATWNPVRGCTKVSPGCKHCYAETFAERWRGVKGHAFEQGFDLRLVPEALEKPIHWAKPRRIFVNSMSDLFHEDVPFEYIDRVFAVMAVTARHTYQLLTKRADRMRDYIKARARSVEFWEKAARDIGYTLKFDNPLTGETLGLCPFPLPNAWLGVSVENQEYADTRIPALLDTPAAVRFLSVEPLLGPVALHPGTLGCIGHLAETFGNPLIHWVIVGGESGPGAREMDPDWVRSIRDAVVDSGASFFMKQWGGVRKKIAGRELDGRTWDEYPEART